MKTFKHLKRNKGFSLVEVLMAVCILGLVAAPILQMFYSSYSMSLKSKQTLAAADLTQHIMEYVSANSFDDYTSASNAALTRQGVYSYYFDNGMGLPHYVFPGGPVVAGGSISTANAPTLYKANFIGVNYSGYKFNVNITISADPAVMSDDYFTYTVNVEIKDETGSYSYHTATTQIVNKY